MRLFLLVPAILHTTSAFLHPLEVQGRQFVDPLTGQRFVVQGVDYQPGGLSAVSSSWDPLLDPDACARDTILFQDLGINAIRVYSVNPDLDHDVCMSLLASAGIYVFLDVNSPLPGQHLHRYEPWTSYNMQYLEHVFKVVHHFSGYNNTAGFFAGNEVVNDPELANALPVYIKALVRDMKQYIRNHAPRSVPVGYSAADDLLYRVPLSEYLECVDERGDVSTAALTGVDFYGVNLYQWCGEQTYTTSGYDVLVDLYSGYSRPVFFLEYGCNEVTPRGFLEVGTMFGRSMTGVFSGGLVYEFTQEANNYGLVEEVDGVVYLLDDFEAFRKQLDMVEPTAGSLRRGRAQILPVCREEYPPLDVSRGVPLPVAAQLVKNGVAGRRGELVPLTKQQLSTTKRVVCADGSDYPREVAVEEVVDLWDPEQRVHEGKKTKWIWTSAGGLVPVPWMVAVWLFTI